MKAKHCDFCIHVSGTFDARKCELGHKPRFYMPKSHTDERWGWMRRCEDFEEATYLLRRVDNEDAR